MTTRTHRPTRAGKTEETAASQGSSTDFGSNATATAGVTGPKGPTGPDPNYDPSQDPNSDWWKKLWEPKDKQGHDLNEEPGSEAERDHFTKEKTPQERLDEILKRFEIAPDAQSTVLAFLAGAITVVALVATLEVTVPAAALASLLVALGVSGVGTEPGNDGA